MVPQQCFRDNVSSFAGALRCLNTVCAHSAIFTADVKNKHGACTAIILFCPVKIVQVTLHFWDCLYMYGSRTLSNATHAHGLTDFYGTAP